MSPLPGPPVRAVLVDYGGTLTSFVRPDAALRDAYAEIRARLLGAGFDPPPAATLLRDVHDRVEDEFARHRAGGSAQEIDLVAVARRAYADLGLVLDDAHLDECLRLEQEAWWQGVTVEAEAIPALDALRAAGLGVGLCSNAPYRVRSMHDQLAHVGLREHLDTVTFSAEVGWCKPDRRLFDAALAALGANAAEAVMVGDSEEQDIAGAHRSGIRAVLYRRASRAGTPAPATEADALITRLAELPTLLVPPPLPILGRQD